MLCQIAHLRGKGLRRSANETGIEQRAAFRIGYAVISEYPQPIGMNPMSSIVAV